MSLVCQYYPQEPGLSRGMPPADALNITPVLLRPRSVMDVYACLHQRWSGVGAAVLRAQVMIGREMDKLETAVQQALPPLVERNTQIRALNDQLAQLPDLHAALQKQQIAVAQCVQTMQDLKSATGTQRLDSTQSVPLCVDTLACPLYAFVSLVQPVASPASAVGGSRRTAGVATGAGGRRRRRGHRAAAAHSAAVATITAAVGTRQPNNTAPGGGVDATKGADCCCWQIAASATLPLLLCLAVIVIVRPQT